MIMDVSKVAPPTFLDGPAPALSLQLGDPSKQPDRSELFTVNNVKVEE